jgi:hypothetical protein
MKLFAIYIGGEFPGANIEVHDGRFVVAAAIQETYATLRRDWWGAPRSPHIDCWAQTATKSRCVSSRSPGQKSSTSSIWPDTSPAISRNATATSSS